MTKRALRLRFRVHLERYEMPEFYRPKGPLFHRWLPNGLSDAISVPMRDSRNRLSIWIERRGFVEGGFIKFDPGRAEVDVDIMRRQAKIEAGALCGEMKLGTLTSSELEAVLNNRINSTDYTRVGKIVCEIVAGAVGYISDILRNQYGQFWLAEFEEWDARVYTLGAYCGGVLGAMWKDSDTDLWHPFRPTDPMITGYATRPPGRGYEEYLTECDWRKIQKEIASGEPFGSKKNRKAPLALLLVGKAHELHASRHVRQAVIEAVTALEVALGFFMSSVGLEIADHKEFKDRCRLSLCLTIVGRSSGRIGPELLKEAVRGIELRNAIVHEGGEPPKDYATALSAMLKAAVALLRIDEHKMPVVDGGNELAPPGGVLLE
jgi:hypothetical protein